jgi:ribonuclease BN (tRNA processing enzyme)
MINKKFIVILLSSFLLLFISMRADSNSESRVNHKTRIILLGTGTPIVDPDRSGPSVAIVVNNIPYLIDSGSGVVRQIVAAYQQGTMGLRYQNLKRLFITHLHSDHTLGYPDLIFTPWVLGRDEPMEVYGPKGIKSMTEHILAAYQQDIQIRLNGLEHMDTSGYKVNVHEIEPGIIYQDSLVKVEAFLVNHGSWPLAYAYKFYTPNRTIVISGDTSYSENMIKKSKGVDVLIHEVYNTKGFEKIKNSKFQAYHSNYHTSSENLAKIATKAKPGLLILYHQLWMNQSEDDLLKEIKERYSGNVVSGKDLEIY